MKTELKQLDNNFLATFLVATGMVGVRRVEEVKLLGDGKIEPRFIKATDGHFFDINTNSNEEVAKVVLEELVTRDQSKKITNSEPVRTVGGVPQIEFSEYNVHARAEWEATHRSFDLAKSGSNLIFWISAEDGAKGLSEKEAKEKGFVYADGRFNIYFRSVENGEVILKGKHLPLGVDRFQSLELGKRLMAHGGKTLGKMETVEDLRVQPIGFDLENLDNWIGKCREMMPEFEIFWRAIENGDDLKQEEEMKKVVDEVKTMAKGDNVFFQMELARRGIKINSGGNHGSGYLKEGDGILNFTIFKDGDNFISEKIEVNGKLVCPICGLEVSEGTMTCSVCGVSLKNKS